MPTRKSLRWSTDLPDPGELLSQDERDERTRLAWTVFVLLLAGIAAAGFAVWAMML